LTRKGLGHKLAVMDDIALPVMDDIAGGGLFEAIFRGAG
jgi:hypothetical protein